MDVGHISREAKKRLKWGRGGVPVLKNMYTVAGNGPCNEELALRIQAGDKNAAERLVSQNEGYLTELARASVQINTVTFEPVWVFGLASLIYFSLCWPLSLYAAHLERRFAVGQTRKVEEPLMAA